MAWVKLDDDFFSNPKVVRAGRDARDLYLAGLCFCNRGLTDGFIPAEALRRLAADAEVEAPEELAARLVETGLWMVEAGGFRVHQFLDYQPSAEAVREKRSAAAERMRQVRSREVRANISRTSREVRPTPSRTRPVPVPVPVERDNPPVVPPLPTPDAGRAGADAPAKPKAKPKSHKTALPDDFALDDDLLDWTAKQGWEPARASCELDQFRDHHAKVDSRFADWRAAWRTWVRNGRKFDAAGGGARASPNGMTRPEKARPRIPSIDEVLQPAKALSPQKVEELRAWREDRR